MSEWMKLPNPFLNVVDNAEVITGHVSGRYTDIVEIITGSQSAIILAGAPQIGKTTLLRYLQRSPETKAGWSWRDELASIRKEFHLDKVHFVPVDLTGLEEIETKEQVLKSFIKVCVDALY